MNKSQTYALLVLRVSMGWLFTYAGLSKILNPDWTADAYLKAAKTAVPFYALLHDQYFLPRVNFLVEWGLLLLGLSLLVGLCVRVSTWVGMMLMALFYLPILHFPWVGEHGLLVDEHIVYICVLAVLWATNAGTIFGLDRFVKTFCSKRMKVSKQ